MRIFLVVLSIIVVILPPVLLVLTAVVLLVSNGVAILMDRIRKRRRGRDKPWKRSSTF